MKTIRICLSVIAIVLSVCGAIGSSILTQESKMGSTVYQWVDYAGTEDDMCIAIQIDDCNETGMFPCKCYGATYRKEAIVATQCGIELSRDTPFPPACF